YAGLQQQVQHCRQLLEALQAIRREMAALRAEGMAPEDIELLAHQLKEIEQAELREDEEAELVERYRMATHAKRLLELVTQCRDGLAENDGSVVDQLGGFLRLLREIEQIDAARGEVFAADLGRISESIQELCVDLADYAGGLELDEEAFQQLEERLDLVQKLKRKYGPSLADILQTLAAAKTRLQDLQTRDQQKADVEKELLAVEKELQTAGRTLRKRRAAAAEKLAPAITAELQALGFAHGLFAIELTPSEAPLASGLDKLEFAFAPNVGEPMRPLRAIASSGEISRVMLGIKVVVAAADRIPLLVFDEIDANVGGETARAVGQKLAQAAKRRQVIAITHLPTVAACGAHHHAVRKEVQAGRTHTRVVALDHAARVEELARMLGGRESTSVTLRHAAELLATTPTS
ncbi:MAG TPA: DNA repair protein RecN, partial [Kiritimatiellia bacterium]|nr:DNA repair protein RecN [Kiritimatiellia bacterium]